MDEKKTQNKNRHFSDLEKQEFSMRYCCPPKVMGWIDTLAKSIFVENSTDSHHMMAVNAGVSNTVIPPQTSVQDGASDSKIEDTTKKDQGKIYRTDSYTIHWQTLGNCHPIQVQLKVQGEIQYIAKCLPESGEITLSRTYLLLPPAYTPPGPGYIMATLNIMDCSGQTDECTNEVPRP